jgi:dTDP-4-amino-4,6-dideoxygalactose transaminase
MNQNEKILVAQPSLPPLEQFMPYLKEIWDSKLLTNGGRFHRELESKLAEYLGVPYISLFSNATIALLTAFKALRVKGEVITTPYSFVATSHSLLWNGLKPVFVDIEPGGFNISAEKIEAAITNETTAILPVHCYGTPCNTTKIQEIADSYNLKIIYDAAHAFGVTVGGKSILNEGDLSIVSFHATKVFNTFEGGAIISHDLKTKKHIDNMKNFGFINEVSVATVGINGKMSEFNAALGLLQLGQIDELISRRNHVDKIYRLELSDVDGIEIPEISENFKSNHSYFPIRIKSNFPHTRDDLYFGLRDMNVMARRYFYPLISEFPMYRDLPSSVPNNLPMSHLASSQIICLPMHAELSEQDVYYVVNCIKEIYRQKKPYPLAA